MLRRSKESPGGFGVVRPSTTPCSPHLHPLGNKTAADDIIPAFVHTAPSEALTDVAHAARFNRTQAAAGNL